MPEGPGSLAFTSGERFIGTFKGGMRNRVGQVNSTSMTSITLILDWQVVYPQGEVQRVQGEWKDGFLEGKGRVEQTAGGWQDAIFRWLLRPARYRNVSIGLDVLTDLRGPLALQAIRTATSGERVLRFMSLYFIKLALSAGVLLASTMDWELAGFMRWLCFLIHKWMEDEMLK